MKPIKEAALILTILSLGAINTYAENYAIDNPQQNGFVVAADENGITLTTPTDGKKKLSEPFVTKNIKNTPTDAIECSWNTEGTFLAIFVPHNRMSEIHVVDLKTSQQLKQVFPDITWPNWYKNVYSAISHPKEWESGAELNLNTVVTLKSNDVHPLPELLTIEDGQFSIINKREYIQRGTSDPSNSSPITTQGTTEATETIGTTQPLKPASHSIEFH